MFKGLHAIALASLGRLAEASAKDRGKPVVSMERPQNGLPEDIRDRTKYPRRCLAVALPVTHYLEHGTLVMPVPKILLEGWLLSEAGLASAAGPMTKPGRARFT